MSLRSLMLAVGFLSRLPTPTTEADPRALGQSPLWYPWVGAMLGTLACAAAGLFAGASPVLAAAVYSTALLVLSGGVHVDGLADTADAWVGGLGDRERTLSIMKDPSCGPMAVGAVCALLLLRFGAAHALVVSGGWWALVLAPGVGRGAGAILLACVPTARPEGMAAALKHRLARDAALWSAGAFALATLVLAIGGWLMLAAAASITALLARAFRRRLGGITGDTLGATIELAELAALLAAALWLAG